MIKPLFGKGKTLQRNLSHPEPAGSQTLHIASPGGFSPGDRVFCSEVGGSELEYLGPVTSVEPDAIQVTHGLAAAKNASAIVWKPEGCFQWPTIASSPVERVFHEGIATERAVGGALWSVRTSDPWREDTLRFQGISRAHFAELRAWLAAHARGGLDDFTWVDEAREIARVRLLHCDFTQIEKTPHSMELAIQLAVLEEGDYA